MEMKLADGSVIVDKLVFQDVSIKHGGFFVLKVTPMVFLDEIRPWRSPKLIIRSTKTHFTRRKRDRLLCDNPSSNTLPNPASKKLHWPDLPIQLNTDAISKTGVATDSVMGYNAQLQG